MRALLDRLSGPLHVGLASMSVFLVGASPWLHMYRSLPRQASFFNLSHVVLGVLVLAMVLVYSVGCCRGGRWRLYFPWLAGQWSAVGRDLGAIAQGRLPGVEGGGLFAMIEGLLLLALLGTGVTGVAWLLVQGTDTATTLCDVHGLLALSFAGLMLLHLVTVSLHLVDFIRD